MIKAKVKAKESAKPVANSKEEKAKVKKAEPKAAKKETAKAKIEYVEPAKPKAKHKDISPDVTIEERLKALYALQQIDTAIDKIRIVRGELPLEVQDLEDEIVGLETRVKNYTDEVNVFEDIIVQKKQQMKDSLALIKKYEEQQNKVRNNREFDSLTKEIEFQNLEIQLCEKRIKEAKANIAAKNEFVEKAQAELDERKADLKHKKAELDDIIKETEKEEKALLKESVKAEEVMEERLLTAYKRIRSNARNGLAVVTVARDACGGCFNNIPPQRQMDIRMRKKIIVCEYCGRVLVDQELAGVEVVEEEA
ncbi:MAG: zinc ribbon domain-containing protein [Bacteroidia bacterium]